MKEKLICFDLSRDLQFYNETQQRAEMVAAPTGSASPLSPLPPAAQNSEPHQLKTQEWRMGFLTASIQSWWWSISDWILCVKMWSVLVCLASTTLDIQFCSLPISNKTTNAVGHWQVPSVQSTYNYIRSGIFVFIDLEIPRYTTWLVGSS